MQVQHEPVSSAEVEFLLNQIERLTTENRALREQLDRSIVLQEEAERLASENRALKEQLIHKEQFMAMIAHDLLGPLTSIINYAKIVTRLLGGNPNLSIRRKMEIIISQSQRMTRLINDLRDSSNIESNKFSLKLALCDIVELVHETADQLRPIAPHHRIELDISDTGITGMYDRERLQQVLGNLLDNAIKYSDTETIITIRVWTTSNTVNVSVHNQGPGIPSQEVSMLFLPFVRLSGVGQRKGSGLGLYISHSIIQAHHGTLRLVSHLEQEESASVNTQGKDEQKGVTFCFTLPLTQQA